MKISITGPTHDISKVSSKVILGLVFYNVTNLNVFSLIALMEFVCVKKISNLKTISISSSNAYYTYLKEKPLWRKSLMWSSQFLIKTKIAFVILYPSVSISLMTLKTSAYSATIEYILATERLNVKAMANNTSAVSIYLYLYLYIYLYIYIYLSV